jgi:hypothetical protein
MGIRNDRVRFVGVALCLSVADLQAAKFPAIIQTAGDSAALIRRPLLQLRAAFLSGPSAILRP